MTVELPGVPPHAKVNDVVTQMIRKRARPASFETWWKKVEEVDLARTPSTDWRRRTRPGSSSVHPLQQPTRNRLPIMLSDLYARDTSGSSSTPAFAADIMKYLTTVAEHPEVFVTLTAPSFGAVHTTRTTGSCHPRVPTGANARTGVRAGAKLRTTRTSPRSGQPLCRDCYDYVGGHCSPGMLQNSGGALRFSFGGS